MALLAVACMWAPVGTAAQQGHPTEVRVQQVAGATLYLNLGVRNGVVAGDTLAISRELNGETVGRMVVTAATDTRSVLTFVGAPFAVTRGEVIVIGILREGREAAPSVRDATPSAAAPLPMAKPGVTRRPMHGRIGVDMSVNRSSTGFGGADPVAVSRTFATPTLRFNLTAPGAVGGFTFRAHGRAAYRYSSLSAIEPTTSVGLYTASLERDFETVPLQMALGRMRSPAETYSGFWDGLYVRVGGRDAGIGALVGFEPDRWTEAFSTTRPKASVFADVGLRGADWRWNADVSAHVVRPTDSLPDHTFLGLSQRVSAGPLRLSQDVQVDRDLDGSWHVGRIRARASVALPSGVHLYGGFVRREEFREWRLEDLFAPRRDRVDGGLSYRGAGGGVSASVSTSSREVGGRTWGYSGTADSRSLPWLPRAGGIVAMSVSTGPYGQTYTVAPAVDFDAGGYPVRAGYRLYRFDYLGRTGMTHALEASTDVELGSGLRGSLRLRTQRGGGLNADAIQVTVFRVF